MLNYLKTAFEFTKNLSTTGAFSETSPQVVNKISKFVNKNEKQIIIEFGAGHGNITRGILSKMHPESVLYAFEINLDFCDVLSNIKDTRLVVVKQSAENVTDIIQNSESVDCIISSIPFSFLKNEVINMILSKSHNLLKDKSYMTQVLYTPIHLKHYKPHFQNCISSYTLNFPIASVYECQKIK